MENVNMIPADRAEAIKEICYKNIANPDMTTVFAGNFKNVGIAGAVKVREDWKRKLPKMMSDLEKMAKTSEMKGLQAVGMLDDLMSVMHLLDNYTIETCKERYRRSASPLVTMATHGTVMFYMPYDGDDKLVVCNYYDGISGDEKLLAEFLNMEDEEQQVEFVKKHVELGTVEVYMNEHVTEGLEHNSVYLANIDEVAFQQVADKQTVSA